MSEIAPICTGFWSCAYAYQTLAAGFLAVLAGLGTAWVIWRAAHLPVREESKRQERQRKRRRTHGQIVLMGELATVRRRASQSTASIRVMIANNTSLTDALKSGLYLSLPAVLSEWEVVSLFPDELQQKCMDFANDVHEHNNDVERAGGAFGDNNFRRQVLGRLGEIEQAAAALRTNLAVETKSPVKTTILARDFGPPSP